MAATRRALWRASTMLCGSIGAMFLSVWSARAADLVTKAPALQSVGPGPAVDGFNARFEGFGGELAKKSIWGKGLVVGAARQQLWPSGRRFVRQVRQSRLSGRRRSPVLARSCDWALGPLCSFTNWDSGFGQVQVGQVAAEAALYWGRFSVNGVAGVEFGNSVTSTFDGFVNTIDIDTRFFDKVNLSFYLHDNLELFVGHRYLGGKNAAAFGGEWGIPIPSTTAMASAFVEGRVGDFTGVWGGLKLYIGQKDKTLIRRHREDDPIPWAPETLATIRNQQTQAALPPPRPPSE